MKKQDPSPALRRSDMNLFEYPCWIVHNKPPMEQSHYTIDFGEISDGAEKTGERRTLTVIASNSPNVNIGENVSPGESLPYRFPTQKTFLMFLALMAEAEIQGFKSPEFEFSRSTLIRKIFGENPGRSNIAGYHYQEFARHLALLEETEILSNGCFRSPASGKLLRNHRLRILNESARVGIDPDRHWVSFGTSIWESIQNSMCTYYNLEYAGNLSSVGMNAYFYLSRHWGDREWGEQQELRRSIALLQKKINLGLNQKPGRVAALLERVLKELSQPGGCLLPASHIDGESRSIVFVKNGDFVNYPYDNCARPNVFDALVSLGIPRRKARDCANSSTPDETINTLIAEYQWRRKNKITVNGEIPGPGLLAWAILNHESYTIHPGFLAWADRQKETGENLKKSAQEKERSQKAKEMAAALDAALAALPDPEILELRAAVLTSVKMIQLHRDALSAAATPKEVRELLANSPVLRAHFREHHHQETSPCSP